MLAFAASTLGFVLGCVLGGLAGTFRGSVLDRTAVGVAVAGVSVPHYWLGMVMVVIFSVQLNWLPAMGAGPGGSSDWGWDWEHIRHLVLPMVTLSVIPMGIVTRTVRGIVAEIMNQEFVVALRGKGLTRWGVFRHVVKNAAPNALAVMGLQLGYLMGGSILVETVFSWPGTGLLLNSAIFQRDLPVLQGTILVLAMFFVALNLWSTWCRRRSTPGSSAAEAMARSDMSTATTPTAAEAELAVQAKQVQARSEGYWAGVWKRVRRDPVTIVCGSILLVMLLAIIFAPLIAPHDPTRAA